MIPRSDGFPHEQHLILTPDLSATVPLSLLRPLRAGVFPRAQGHARARPAGCNEWVVIVCRSGKGWCESAGKNWTVEAGTVLTIAPQTPHHYGSDQDHPWTIDWLHAIGDAITAMGPSLGVGADGIGLLSVGRNEAATNEFLNALDRLAVMRPAAMAEAGARLQTWLWRLVDAAQERSLDPNQGPDLARALTRMRTHFTESLTVAELAAEAGCSEAHFNHCFKQRYGSTPIAKLITLRLQRAAELLISTTLTVQYISEQVGYQNPYYFSRHFKRQYGMPPKRWRRMNIGG